VEVKPLAEKERDEEMLFEADQELQRQLAADEKKKASVKSAEIPIVDKVATVEKPSEKLTFKTSEPSVATLKKNEKKIDLKEAWNRLRLDPRIEMDEENSFYLLYLTLPGMKKEDITIEISPEQSTISIEGLRVPTPDEESQMRRIVKMRHAPSSEYEENIWILKYSVGRFGKFSRTYRIPNGVSISDIKGNFKEGILTLIIPKGGPHQIPVRTSHDQNQNDRKSPFGSQMPFYGDPSVWW